VVSEVVRFFAADPDRARLLVREVLDRPDEMAELIARHVQPWLSLVSDYIRTGQAQGRIFAEVDPEAYCLHVTNLVVSGVATYDTTAAVAGACDETIRARHIRELLRIARASLFVPRAAGPAPGASA
jgi:hypothetical protein